MQVRRTSSEGRNKRNARFRADATLQITAGILPEKAIFEFVEDCIVPELVEGYLRSKMNLPEFAIRAHNVDQP